MDFAPSARTEELRGRLADFVAERVDPAEAVYAEQVAASGDPHFHPPVMEDLKAEARARGLWNLFLPGSDHGPGLSNLEYAPLCELMGQSPLSQEATNCSAPDTGNMEALVKFATPLQAEQFLRPLLDGETRSCFAMTEPWVASSDATNITSRITRDGDHYVVNAHKWWTSGAASSRCTLRHPHGGLRSRRRPPPASQHGDRAVRHAGRVGGPLAPRVRPRRGRRALRDAVRGRPHPEGVPARRGGRRVRDRAGPPGTGADPSLHARHRHGREGVAAHVRAHPAARRVRQADRRPGHHPGADRGVADRDRAGPAPHHEGGMADGHRRGRRARGSRSPPSRSWPPGSQPRSSTAPSRRSARRASPTTGRWPRCTRTRAPCTSSTVPTRCTCNRSPGGSCAATSRSGPHEMQRSRARRAGRRSGIDH